METKETRPSAMGQIFGHFTKREFWIELLEGLVKASVTAFFIALGETLIRHGRQRGGGHPDIFTTKEQTPAAQAFSRGFNPSIYSQPSQPPAPPSDNWPGFGKM